MITKRLKTTGGLTLEADIGGDPSAPAIVLLHGGGQTRHSWKNGVTALLAEGYQVICYDARGHGGSDWAGAGCYTLDAMVGDLHAVLREIPSRPALVGASMGGLTALAAVGESASPIARALVLVDVAPRIAPQGAKRVGDFMRSHPDGFASVAEAADAVAEYNPNRPRPKDVSGLRRNLREVGGRLYWHWDPAFLGQRTLEPEEFEARLVKAAQAVRIPTLLVRGSLSDIVGDDEAAQFRALMPNAGYVNVADAGHMVAGDRNDAFNAAILDFLAGLDREAGCATA